MIPDRVVQIVGDGIDGRWLTWRWGDGSFPLGVAQTDGLQPAVQRLRASLPLNEDRGALELALNGALTRLDTETGLMRDLADALLPAELQRQLLSRAGEEGRLQVRVAPSRPASIVPWGLLLVGGELRLLEFADVSWLAPPLPRDVGRAPQPPSWEEVKSWPALHVLDPRLAAQDQVLLSPDDALRIVGEPSGATAQNKVTGDSLSRSLHERTSRFFFLGHCAAGGEEARRGLVLSDLRGGRHDPLTAAELIADPKRWPMPPRAAVVACSSGSDMADFEPFGLATALLHNGAGLVQATLWTIPTDSALREHGEGTEGAFLALARGLEVAQRSDDPVATLHAWQRERLQDWKDRPSLDTSPLLWGSAMTMTAPPRRLPGVRPASRI